MNKAELVRSVASKAGLTQNQATRALDATLDSIAESMVRSEPVMLIGFGTFEVRQRSARQGRNPSTREVINIPASKTVALKPGKALKDKVN